MAAQRGGAGAVGEVPAAPGPGQLAGDPPAPGQGRGPAASAAVRGRDLPGPLQPEAGPAEGAGLAGAAPGPDLAGTLGRHRSRSRRPPRLAAHAPRRAGRRREARAAGRAGLQDPRPGHGPADRRRRHPPRPGLADGDVVAAADRERDGPGPRPGRACPAAGLPQGRDGRGGHRRSRDREGRADHGRQGRPGRRHHRRGLPGAGQDQPGGVPRAVAEHQAQPVLLPAAARRRASSPPPRRRRCGCSTACSPGS